MGADSDRDRQRFADRVADELRKQGVEGDVAYDDEQFKLSAGGVDYFLANIYSDWQQASRLRRGAVIRESVQALADQPGIPADVDAARPNLLPRVRDAVFIDLLALRFAEGPALTFVPLNDALVVEVVYDHPRSVASLDPEQLAAWGMDVDEALRTARANLRDRTEGSFERAGPGVYGSPWHDTYDASRLLLTELIAPLDVQGDPVALLPHRDLLLVTGSDDAPGLAKAAELAEPLLDDGRRVTGRAFVWRDGVWQPYAPPEGHPAAERFGRLSRITDALDYGEQQGLLQQRLGDDVYVAEATLMQDTETGEVRSYSTWTQTVPTSLPRTDGVNLVAMADGKPEFLMTAPWADVVAAAGDLMRPEELSPPRWRVDGFPDEATLAELRR